MPLYNEKKRVAYLSSEEVQEILIDYFEFIAHREDFLDGSFLASYAENLKRSIGKMRKIPNEIRSLLPDNVGITNYALTELEKKVLEKTPSKK
jgi:hypothetical protein